MSAVPVVGGAATELLELIESPVDRRTKEWIENIAIELNRLRERVAEQEDRDIFEEIFKDERFVTTLLEASRAATRMTDDEKCAALSNAILNSAVRTNPDKDMQAIFVDLLGRFTPSHLRILKFYDDPRAQLARVGQLEWVDRGSAGGVGDVLEMAHPEFKGRQEFYRKVVNDLKQEGLVNGGLGVIMTRDGAVARRTTDWGRRFLRFITTPDERA